MKSEMLAKWLNETPVESKDSLIIYETKKERVEPETVLKIARRFNLYGEVQSERDIYVVCQAKRVLVMYKASGAIYYGDFARLHQPDYRPELPSEKEAEKIAIGYLKQNDWWPETAILDKITVGQFERVEGEKRSRQTVHPNHLCVEPNRSNFVGSRTLMANSVMNPYCMSTDYRSRTVNGGLHHTP